MALLKAGADIFFQSLLGRKAGQTVDDSRGFDDGDDVGTVVPRVIFGDVRRNDDTVVRLGRWNRVDVLSRRATAEVNFMLVARVYCGNAANSGAKV